MNRQAIILAVIGLVMVGGILILAKTVGSNQSQQQQQQAQAELVRDDSARLGPEDAKVTIVEFGDYQCPACAATAPILSRIQSEQSTDVALVFRHFPLPMHDQAKLGAYAAESAGALGEYWMMHDWLYAHQNAWVEAQDPKSTIADAATSFGLDRQQFLAKLDDPDIQAKVDRDLADAQALSLTGTPTLFINGVQYQGQLDYDSLKRAVDQVMQEDLN